VADAVVPRASCAIVARTVAICDERATSATVFHAGDGNLREHLLRPARRGRGATRAEGGH
jgi:hypothetical protein